MASPSDSNPQEPAARKQSKGTPFKFLVPLVYAPVLPLIRISLRKNPVLRDRLFTAVLVGLSLMACIWSITSIEMVDDKNPKQFVGFWGS